MTPLTAADAQTQSADIVAANIARLRELFPEAFTEGKIDFDVLKQLLGGTVDEREEKYGLNWHGKRRARQLALSTSSGTLRPAPGDGVDEATTKNIVIEGDNLEVLKLLQKSYSGQVKLIYIDPPYNTGNDFVYPDDFRDSIGNYKRLTGQVDGEGRKLTNNPETSGRFHTDWLNMMYPRLKLARNLLREDGLIFVNLDDSEITHLRQAMNEVFGEENFVANIVWQKRYVSNATAKYISDMHDHIAVYARNIEKIEFGFDARTEEQLKDYKNPDNDPRGPWRAQDLSASKPYQAGMFEIQGPTGLKFNPPSNRYWRCNVTTYEEWLREKRITFGVSNTGRPMLKSYLAEAMEGLRPNTWWDHSSTGHNKEATLELKSMFSDDSPFDTPKPTRLLQRILKLLPDPEGLILDFFAGSGTTGHAVMAQNAADGGNRRYILVQLPEPLDPANKDQKTAAAFCDSLGKPRTIAELTKERLRRAGTKIREESTAKSAKDAKDDKKKGPELFEEKKEKPKGAKGTETAPPSSDSALSSFRALRDFRGSSSPGPSPDLGFRVFKLDSSNIRTWEPDKADLPKTLEEQTVHIKPDRTDADILVELLLKLGLDLCVAMETKTVAGKAVQSIGAGVLLVCLDESITRTDAEPLALGIAAWHKQLAPAGESQVVFRDSAFEDDVAKSNLAAILQQHGLRNVRSL